ncbi:MAG: TAT-variant-translocated molybdopterin oxidoreductase [Planctomycetota bacterium]|nr:TAT-variant-translocated molybdopterin oxidoreductase [Planctomycetota bacterium]
MSQVHDSPGVADRLRDLHAREHGPRLWRSLDELAQTPAFERWAAAEFPALKEDLSGPTASPTSRRTLLKVMAASLALAGLPACRRPEHKIHAYAESPPEFTPGTATYYATTLAIAGEAVGVLAESHEGRPTKLEGNPLHPASQGALSAHMQATVLDLYDPDRSRYARKAARPVRYDPDVVAALDDLARAHRADQGKGLAVLIEDDASPSTARLLAGLKSAMPGARIYVHESMRAPGTSTAARYDLAEARVILSLDADLIGVDEQGTRAKRGFASGRKPEEEMNRLYVVEPQLTLTGMAADHRLRLRASDVADYAVQLAAHMFGSEDAALADAAKRAATTVETRWIEAVAADLRRAGPRALVAAGERQPPVVHAIARMLNERLQSVGQTVRYVTRPRHDGDLTALAEALRAGGVETLLLLGTNPVYDAPADLGFGALLDAVPTSLHLADRYDETSARCTWHVPRAHPLESWGDAQDGTTLSPVQPLIAPLFGGRTALELLARIQGSKTTNPYQIARDTFRDLTGGERFEARWRDYLSRGIATAAANETPAPTLDAAPLLAAWQPKKGAAGLEVCFGFDESVLDGRFANNGWLQETPDPVTKLTWDNAATITPATAREADLENGDVVALTLGEQTIEIPVFVLPGGAPGSVRLPLGYGRAAAGSLARHAGVDVHPLRTSDAWGFATGVVLRKTDRRHELAGTQQHWAIETHEELDDTLEDRAIVREGTKAEYAAEPDFAQHMGLHKPHSENIGDAPEFTGEHQWGMAIDLSTCVGCTACLVACQSENNVPIVGRDEVLRGREMSWIRIDRYFRGEDPEGDIDVSNQPMLCQHCENAPCETVCPVNATVHDQDGLNVMTYNRCVGTRYCSNNCPYKVRRFNFADYGKDTLRQSDAPFDGSLAPDPVNGLTAIQLLQPEPGELAGMQKNPDVTVRMRGVMEKCTFCVQRIQRAKIDAKVEAGQTRAPSIADGTLKTACQQACPTEAIVFGNIRDPEAEVSKLRESPRGYGALEHLNTRPRVTYLARIRNPNPAMATTSERVGGSS